MTVIFLCLCTDCSKRDFRSRHAQISRDQQSSGTIRRIVLLLVHRQTRTTLGADRRQPYAHGLFPDRHSIACRISTRKRLRGKSICSVGVHRSHMDLQLHFLSHCRPTELDYSGRDFRHPDQGKRSFHIYHDHFRIQYYDRTWRSRYALWFLQSTDARIGTSHPHRHG